MSQEIVRRHYAGFISQHSHNQMMAWHQKFGGVEKLEQNHVTLTKQVKTLQSSEVEKLKQSNIMLTSQLKILQEGMRELQKEKQEREEKRIRKAMLDQRGQDALERRERHEREQRRNEKEMAERKARGEHLSQLRITQLVGAGNEQIYQRFLNGKLIYKPNTYNDIGKIELKIADIPNPLEGKFDLSKCGDSAKYLSISTGYRKNKGRENGSKAEIWFTPGFLVEKEINGSAQHFKPIFPDKWPQTAPVGIFWTMGGWDSLDIYDYLTTQTMDNCGGETLYAKGLLSSCCAGTTNGSKVRTEYVIQAEWQNKLEEVASSQYFMLYF